MTDQPSPYGGASDVSQAPRINTQIFDRCFTRQQGTLRSR